VVMGVSPVFVSVVNITVSFSWTLGTVAVSGWSGVRERYALAAGAILMFCGMAGIVLNTRSPNLWLLVPCAFLFGFGVGMHFVHLMSRAMHSALKGEERITAAALTSMRSVGMAFGAALLGVLTVFSTEPEAVRGSLGFIFGAGLIPLGLTVIATFYLLHHNTRKPR
jgi:MFS family permease